MATDYEALSVDELDDLNVSLKAKQLAIREERQALMDVRNRKVGEEARMAALKAGNVDLSPGPADLGAKGS